MNFIPEAHNPHFSYGFYKKQVLAEVGGRSEAIPEELNQLETTVLRLLGTDIGYRLTGVFTQQQMRDNVVPYLTNSYDMAYNNGTPEHFWGVGGIEAEAKSKTTIRNAECIKMIDWESGGITGTLQSDEAIAYYNLSGLFPYEVCQIHAEVLIIPLNQAIGMESLGTLVMVNDKSDKWDQADFPPSNASTIQLCIKMFDDILSQIALIRRDYLYKHAVFTQAIDDNPRLQFVIRDPQLRSKSIMAFNAGSLHEECSNKLKANKIQTGVSNEAQNGFFRVANFYLHSKEQFEKLADLLASIGK